MGRYDRQLILPEIGETGQQKLAEARVLIVGVGGLGSPVALYLAGAGIGTIGLLDNDVVSEHNLQRQILYSEKEVGQSKVDCAAARLKLLNSTVTYQTHFCRLLPENAEKILAMYDVVVDGCDNFATRYLIDDTCRKLGIPYVYGAIGEFEGQVSVFNYGIKKHFYRDLYPDEKGMLAMPAPPKGVLGATPGVVGSVEASEVFKIVAGYGEVMAGKLWTMNLKSGLFTVFAL